MTITSAALTSSAISGLSYDDETRELTLTFVRGGSYTYSGVPAGVVTELIAARSPGRYYLNNIKARY